MDIDGHEVAENMRWIAEFVLDQDELQGAARGIAKQIVSRGWHTLTECQREVFMEVASPLAKRECHCCGHELEPGELLLGGKYCASCENRIAKDEAKLARE